MSIRIDPRAGKNINGKNAVGGQDAEKIGVEMSFTVSQNNTFIPHKKGTFKPDFANVPQFDIKAGDINNFGQMVAYGDLLGLMGRPGA